MSDTITGIKTKPDCAAICPWSNNAEIENFHECPPQRRSSIVEHNQLWAQYTTIDPQYTNANNHQWHTYTCWNSTQLLHVFKQRGRKAETQRVSRNSRDNHRQHITVMIMMMKWMIMMTMYYVRGPPRSCAQIVVTGRWHPSATSGVVVTWHNDDVSQHISLLQATRFLTRTSINAGDHDVAIDTKSSMSINTTPLIGDVTRHTSHTT
jgi:hypothetical protein